MTKGCNIFLAKKLANTCSFVGGRIIMQQDKVLKAKHGWMNPLNAGGNPLLLYKILHSMFFPLVQILCALRLASQKKLTWS